MRKTSWLFFYDVPAWAKKGKGCQNTQGIGKSEGKIIDKRCIYPWKFLRRE
jgi:hypothetical protein